MSSEPVVDLPPSPDRKRSLEDESSSEDEETRGGRFKRQALNSSDSSHPSPAKRDPSDKDPNEYPPGTDPPADGAVGPDGEAVNKNMVMRAIISVKEAGIVIGKSGRNVADIRDKSGAKVTVSEQVQGAMERVVTIMGPLDMVAKAFSLVAFKIVEEQQSPTELKQRHTCIRILVPHSRMGSIIGKQGQKIKDVQEASGARITASEEILPHSTERIVSVQGVVDSIHIATYHIGTVLQDHPERSLGTVFYKPIPGLVTGQATANARGPQSGGMHGMPHHQMPRPPVGGGGPGMGASMPPGALQMQQIFIPNEMVGAIIGKGGTKINEIRQMSSCQIKIGEPTDGATERLVTITGTPDANQVALYMLYQRLESEKMRMNNGR
ncbi:hypothetical protein BC829DRAFT_360908 [Chytridium lagenaria]|nr:hypothetical protein BC829DRAFT_360908 [Chytridium lagenaria]